MSCVEFDPWGFVRRSSFRARKREEEKLDTEGWQRYEAECAEEGGLGRDELVRDWEQALRSEQASPEALFALVKRGVPRVLRPRIWKTLSGCSRCKAAAEARGITFDGLRKEAPAPECDKYTVQIKLDLARTFPTHRMFLGTKHGSADGGSTKGTQDLFDMLQAYSNYDSTVHYCQGMNYIAATLLMVMDTPEDAFWTLVAVLKNKGTDSFYTPGMPGLVRECDALDAIVRTRLPAVHRHLAELDIAPILFVVPWLNPMFTSINNWSIVMRVWDLFMLEGIRALRRTCLFFLFTHADKMVKMNLNELLPFILNPPCRRISVSDFVRSITEGTISDLATRGFPASSLHSSGGVLSAGTRRKHAKERGKEKQQSQGFFATLIGENPLAKWVKKTLHSDKAASSQQREQQHSLSSPGARATVAAAGTRRRSRESISPKGVTIAGKVEQRRLSSSGGDIANCCADLSSGGNDPSEVVVPPGKCEDFVTYRGKDWRVTMQNPISPVSLELCTLTRKATLKRAHTPPPYYHSGYDDVVYFNSNTDSEEEEEGSGSGGGKKGCSVDGGETDISMIVSTSVSMDNGDDDEKDKEGEEDIFNSVATSTPTKRRKK